MYLKNCIITNSDAKVLKQYCTNKDDPLYAKYKGFNTTLNLSASEVYSFVFGYVCMVSGDQKHGYDVVIRMNDSQCIRYLNLKTLELSFPQSVDVGDSVGFADKYVAVEYLNKEVSNNFPFRIGNEVFYKDDPEKLIEHGEFNNSGLQYSQSGLQDFVESRDIGVPDSVKNMLTNNSQ